MARVMVLTDRAADDKDWKGAITWQVILSLAEAHHEVMVATPLDLAGLKTLHPRLTVTRPIRSWSAAQMPRLVRAVLTFQPQIIQTFALEKSTTWPTLTLWPYLHYMCLAMPGVRRFSMLFEAEDSNPRLASHIWHQGGDTMTTFQSFAQSTSLLPLEIRGLEEGEPEVHPRILIPAPVSEWLDPSIGLERLREFLRENRDLSVQILGGWGEQTLLERKEGWQRVGEVSARIAMSEALTLEEFMTALKSSQGVWLEPLKPQSWRAQVSARAAELLGKTIYTSADYHWEQGSTANALSRLYSGAKRL